MKRTKKFVAAEKIALKIGVNIDENIYQNLEKNNYFWDSEKGEWFLGEAAHSPTSLVKIRVQADSNTIRQDAYCVITSLGDNGFILEEFSKPFVCRPPKQLESRIYLTFSRL